MKILILKQFKNVIDKIKEYKVGGIVFVEIQPTNLFYTLNSEVGIFINFTDMLTCHSI